MGQSSTFLLQEVNEPSRMQKGEWGIGKGACPLPGCREGFLTGMEGLIRAGKAPLF